MAKRTGKSGICKIGAVTYDVTDWNVAEAPVMEDTVDTASSTVGGLVVDEQEAVAIALTGSVTMFSKDDVTLHSDPPNINGGAEIALDLYEDTTPKWAITLAVITAVRVASAPKRKTKVSFDFRAKSWTRPSS